ncbi:MAG: glycosyltransferase family 4 protein [Planctomycetota bacterium]
MKIAITSLYLPTGSKIGVGYQVHYLANALTRRGHRVTVFSQTGAPDDALYQVEVVPSGKRFRTFGFAWGLRRYDFTEFDVLNAHGDDWFLWGKPRPRHVHTYHGSCLAEAFHAKTWKDRLRMGMLAALETSAGWLCDVRVAVSSNTRKYIPRIQEVVPCGLDLTRFKPGAAKTEKPTILFVGTMHGRKRGQLLLEAFRQHIRPAIPEAELILVAENKVPPEDGVRCLGRIPLDELTRWFSESWVFCLPSSYEGFGVPYIEAMASGTPVVATPNRGAREVLEDGESGCLVKDDQLGPQLLELLRDEEKRDELRQKGLERAACFGWDRICEAYEALYRPPRSSAPTNGSSLSVNH